MNLDQIISIISLVINLVVAIIALWAVWFAKESARASMKAVQEMQKARYISQGLSKVDTYHRGVDEVMKMKQILHDFNFYPILKSADSYKDGFEFVESQGYQDCPEYFMMACGVLFAAENIVRVRRKNLLEQEEWESLSKEIELVLLVPFFKKLWQGIIRKGLFTEYFRERVSEYYKRLDNNENPCFKDLIVPG